MEDANKRNEITTQTLSAFRVPKFEDEKALRTRLLMAENENRRLKDELNDLIAKTSKVPDNMLFSTKDETERKMLQKMIDLKTDMKAENSLMRRELHDIMRSKEAMIYENEGLTKDQEINRLRRILQEYMRKENKRHPTYSKRDDDPDFNEKCLIVKMMNKRFDKDLMKYLFAIWRLKFLLKRTLRLKGKNLD